MAVTAESADFVLEMLHGYMKSTVLSSACKLEIFDEIHKHGEVTLAALTSEKNWNVDATERLLNALVSMGLLTVTKDKKGTVSYANTDHSKFLLRHGSPTVWGAHQDLEIFRQELEAIPDLVRGIRKVGHGEHDSAHDASSAEKACGHGKGQGQTRCQYGLDHLHTSGDDNKKEDDVGKVDFEEGGCSEMGEDGWKSMVGYMEPYVNKIITAFDLSEFKNVADLGGGAGNLARALCRHYSGMNVTVVDRENVIETAKKLHAKDLKENENLKVTFKIADFTKDMPKADLYILAQTAHHFTEDEWNKTMKMAFDNLSPDGGVLFLENYLNADKIGPESSSMWDLSILPGGGRMRTVDEFATILKKYGFKDVKSVRIGGQCSHDPVLARKSRKRKH